MKIKCFPLWAVIISAIFFASCKSDLKSTLKADAKYFTDASCTDLNLDVKREDLDKIKHPALRAAAEDIMDLIFSKKYVAASYEAYPSAKAIAKNLKLGEGFSQYENITGMYLEEGEAIILVGKTLNKEISLLVPYWTRKPAEGIKPTQDPNGWGLHKQEIPLKEGINIVNIERAGNAYIKYFDDNPSSCPKVPIHFLNGKVNGFYDARFDKNSDWDKLLDNAVSPIMDARGKHIQVAYPVEWLKEYTYGQGKELIDNYDKLLNHQYTLMGLVKYNKVPKNRILARVNYNYYMFRDGDGVAYLGDKNTMKMVASPSVVISGDPCWGFCHEVGHVLQMIPQITWGGMMEVSNNIFSMYTSTNMGNESRLKTQNNYEKAYKSIVESNPKISYMQDPDLFNRLVPFWQLHLYFSQQGNTEIYADIMEEMRNRPDSGTGNESINNMFEFIKIACDVTKTDLTDFFDKWGFFYVGNIELDDYGKYEYNITENMVNDTKEYIKSKNYPTPNNDITKTVE